jgi:pimeloyl-ACP methyl ester carboxylesterase
VAAVVRKLGLSEVILIGHSMGGAVVIEAARLLPDTVTALIGVDTYQALGMRFTDQQAEGFLARFRPDFRAATDAFVRDMFPADADSALVARIVADMSAAPAEVAIASIKSYLTNDTKSALDDLQLPIRAINSDMFPTNVGLARQAVESFEVEIMPGYGHFPHLENSAGFSDKLKAVIAEFWPTGS